MPSLPRGAHLRGGAEAAKTHRAQAEEFYRHIVPIVVELRQKGLSLREIARELDRRGIGLRHWGTDRPWSATQVRRVLARAGDVDNVDIRPLIPDGQAGHSEEPAETPTAQSEARPETNVDNVTLPQQPTDSPTDQSGTSGVNVPNIPIPRQSSGPHGEPISTPPSAQPCERRWTPATSSEERRWTPATAT